MSKTGNRRNFIHNNGHKGLSFLLIWTLVFHVFTPFASAADDEDKVDVVIQYHDEIPEEPTRFGFLNVPVYENVYDSTTSNIRTASVPMRELSNLLADPRVQFVEEAVPFSFHENADDQVMEELYLLNDLDTDWNNEMVKAYDAWDDGFRGEGVSVAVFDSGFYEHEDIDYAGGHSVIEGIDDFTVDPNGHGTNVAGVIGAFEGTEAEGIAPGVDLFGVKISHEDEGGSNQIGNTGHVIEALDWAIEHEMDVINMSIGWQGYLESVHNMVQAAEENGITMVASGGNNGSEDTSEENMSYPAMFEEVIAVAALDPDKERAYYSSTGVANELSAPGGKGSTGFIDEQIYTINNDPEEKYTYVAGTSSAAPHTAAMAAILKQKHPDKSADEIRQLMVDTAEDLGEEGRDPVYGYGLVRYQPEDDETTQPVLDYDGPVEIKIEAGAHFEWPQVSVDHEEEIDAVMRLFDESGDEVDPDVFTTDETGAFTLRYDAEDSEGNAAEPLYITLIIDEAIDEEPPVIHYEGDTELSVGYDEDFFIPTVEVTDNVDEDLEAEVTIEDESGQVVDRIDTSVPGIYTITYTATDSAGNEAEPVVITVTVEEYVDTEPPVIHYDGDTELSVAYDEDFFIPTVEVTDNVDENLIAEVTIEDESGQVVDRIDTTVPGIYTLTYTATDSAGNVAEPVVITVTVEEEEDPVSFSDVGEQYRFHDEISFLAGEGIITGYLDGRFGPEDTVTRAAAATMIGRTLDLDGSQRETSFPDVNSGNNASGYIESAAELNIIQGFPDGTFRPDDEVTRGQMAIFIARAFAMQAQADMDFTDMSPSMAAYDSVAKILFENITEGFPDGTYRPDDGVTRGQFSAFLSRTLNEDFR